MRQNRRELLFAGGADKRKTGSSPKGLRMMRRCAAIVAAETGADFIVVGKLFSIGGSVGAFVTMIGVKPPSASVAVRQAESVDALMAEVPGLCAELLGNAAEDE